MPVSPISLLLVLLLASSICHANEFDPFEEHPLPQHQPRLMRRIQHVGEYCAVFHEQYLYYCRGIWSEEKVRELHRHSWNIGNFCQAYKGACVTRQRITPEEERVRKQEHKEDVTEGVGELPFDDIMRKLEKIVPCRPNCDVTVHPHCTRRCKCEYEYHRMEKWCKPSRIEERFKYFCRIWYMSCSGYIDEIDPEMAEQFVNQYRHYDH